MVGMLLDEVVLFFLPLGEVRSHGATSLPSLQDIADSPDRNFYVFRPVVQFISDLIDGLLQQEDSQHQLRLLLVRRNGRGIPIAHDHPEPKDPEKFSKDLAESINDLLRSPERRARMGKQARERVVKAFSWRTIAEKTLEFYRELVQG